MTSPESASPSRPAKAAGFALLGVAAVALVIGVVSLFGGSDDSPPAAGSSTPTPTPTSAPETQPSSPGQSSAPPSAPVTTTATPTVPTTTQIQPPPVTQQGTAKEPVRVYNNSTTTGLANRASEEVRANGWQVVETGNYPQGIIPTTTVYYRPGTPEEASAKELASVLRARVEPRFAGIDHAAPGIILIVTNDYQGVSRNK